jgi:hypothetical protein
MMPEFNTVFAADYETGKIFWKEPPKNHAEKRGCEAGYINIGKGKNKNYWQVRAFGRTFKRSRVMFHMAYGRWPIPSVDHINGDSLDDRLVNLRECNHSQNTANTPNRTRQLFLPRGVYLSRKGRYIARITANGITTNLGTYDTPEQAFNAYSTARKETFGEFA